MYLKPECAWTSIVKGHILESMWEIFTVYLCHHIVRSRLFIPHYIIEISVRVFLDVYVMGSIQQGVSQLQKPIPLETKS